MTDVTAGLADAEPASGAIEKFGYRQELKRSLGLFDLVVYGLTSIGLTAPFAYFGIVFNASQGMVPLIFGVGALAMAFTAFSYVTMSRAFPIAGSVYAYAARGIGVSAGFLAGWAMLLDYALLPTLIYVVFAVAIEAILPDVPRFASIILLVGITTAVNLLGIDMTARMNRIFVALQVAFIVLFAVLACAALARGVAGAHLSMAPLLKPDAVTPNLIFAALPVVVLVYLGFDAISTLAEETRGGASMVGRATLLAVFLSGLFFMLETYLLSLFVLDRTSFPPGASTDGAVYDIAETIGGAWFKFAASLKVLLAIATAVAAQTAAARLLFSMARDGRAPRLLARVDPNRKVPQQAILLCSLVNLSVALALANRLEFLVTLISFGAMVGFLLLHLSVVIHFVWRQKSRNWIRHLIMPVIGFAIIAYVLLNMATPAKTAGLIWLAVGVVALIGLKLRGRSAALPA